MSMILSLSMGYLVGCISPASWVSKRKQVDLSQEGTKNLGATNTALVLGKKAGIFVLLFDILKSFLVYKAAKLLFPTVRVAGILASLGTMLGHCYPVTMGFHGGKGLAAFGGMILAYRAWMFPAVVIPGILAMAITNTGVSAPMMGCILFPIYVALSGGTPMEIVCVLLSCLFLVFTHRDNLRLAWEKRDVVNVGQFVEKVFGKKPRSR